MLPKKPAFDVSEARNAIKILNLEHLVFNDYLVIVNSDFDAIIEDEKYIALMLLYNIKSGKFVARVWNETVTVGNVKTLDDFSQACKDHFHFKPCIGIDGNNDEPIFLSSRRKFSQSCYRWIKDQEGMLCTECQKLTTSSLVECKVEISTGDEDSGVPKVEKTDPDETIHGSEFDYKDDLHEVFSDAIAETDQNWNMDGSEVGSNEKAQSDFDDSDYVVDDSNDSDYDGGKIDKLTSPRYGRKRKKQDRAEEHDMGQDYNSSQESNSTTINENRRKKRERQNEWAKKQREKEKLGAKPLTEEQSKNVKCPWCKGSGRPFLKGENFNMHKKKVHFWGEFKCGLCQFIGEFAKDLLEHMKTENHSQNQTVHCPNCKWNVPMLDIESHYQSCVKYAKLKCEICDYQNKSQSEILRHMKVKHFKGLFYCGGCKFLGHFAKEIVDHTRETGHSQDIQCPTSNCAKKLPANEIGPHYEQCLTQHTKHLRREINNRQRVARVCDICGKSITKQSYDKHVFNCKMKLEGGDAKDCDPEDDRVCCDICGKVFTGKWAKNNYSMHKKASHQKNLECPICGYRCGYKDRMRYHMLMHQEPQFKCSICGKGIKTKERLEAHEMDHKGIKPFQCDTCGKGFSLKADLSQHKRLVHKIAGSRARPSKREQERGVTGFRQEMQGSAMGYDLTN